MEGSRSMIWMHLLFGIIYSSLMCASWVIVHEGKYWLIFLFAFGMWSTITFHIHLYEKSKK